MNTNPKRLTAMLLVWLWTGLSLTLFQTAPAFASESKIPAALPADSENMKIEYRYIEGETPDIPETVKRFGREYKLLYSSDPIEEETMPASRTYTYRIEGALTAEQLAEIGDFSDIKLTPIMGRRTSQKEEDVVLRGLPTNDIDELPLYRDDLRLAEVSFEVESRDEFGLPASYIAYTVYRGAETASFIAYYTCKTTYSRTVYEAGPKAFVVVATYAPLAPPPAETAEEAPAPEPAGTASEYPAARPANPIEVFWDTRSIPEKITLLSCIAVIIFALILILNGIRTRRRHALST